MTSDNVGIRFDAGMTYSVVDPAKAVRMLGGGRDYNWDRLQANVINQAQLTLCAIIGSQSMSVARRGGGYTLGDAGMGSMEEAGGGGDGGGGGGGGGVAEASDALSRHSFGDTISHEALRQFSEVLESRCGVVIHAVAIEDISITDKQIAEAMAFGAEQRARNRVRAETATVDAHVERTQADATAYGVIKAAEAEAEAMRLRGVAQREVTEGLVRGLSAEALEILKARLGLDALREVAGAGTRLTLVGESTAQASRALLASSALLPDRASPLPPSRALGGAADASAPVP